MSASSKKISVIGGAGFVGTSFCQTLKDHGIPFEIIDLKMSQRFPDKSKIGDVRDINSISETITGDIIVCLAAVHRDDVRDKNEYYLTNVHGAANVAKVCLDKGIRQIVFTSSVAVYGFAKPDTNENGDIAPFNEYGRTKFAAEEVFRDWKNSRRDNALLIVRPTVIFGEGNRGNVFNLFSQISSGRFVMIGNGKNQKSMAYIGNVAAFLYACVCSDQIYAVYNYVDSPDFDMNSLVSKVRETVSGEQGVGLRLPYWLGLSIGYMGDLVSAITQKNLPISSIRVRKFCSTTAFKSRKLELKSFSPPFTLDEGIRRTLISEFIEPDHKRQVFCTE